MNFGVTDNIIENFNGFTFFVALVCLTLGYLVGYKHGIKNFIEGFKLSNDIHFREREIKLKEQEAEQKINADSEENKQGGA